MTSRGYLQVYKLSCIIANSQSSFVWGSVSHDQDQHKHCFPLWVCSPALGLPCCWLRTGHSRWAALCSSSGAADSKTEPAQPRPGTETSSASTVTLSQTCNVWPADLELGVCEHQTTHCWRKWVVFSIMHIYLQPRDRAGFYCSIHGCCSSGHVPHRTPHVWKDNMITQRHSEFVDMLETLM